MKLVILAAGKGVRMDSLTKDSPKPMIEVENHPFLSYLVDVIRKAGFSDKDVAIVVGYKKEKIIDYLKKRKVNFKIIEQEEQLGTAHAIACAEDFVGRSNFVVVMADNIYGEEDIRGVSQADDFCYLAAFRHSNPEKFGVVVEKNGFLARIIEKSKNPPSDLINTGLYKFAPEIFDAIKRIKKSPRGEYEITDAISLLAKQKKVRVVHARVWLDLGTPEDIKVVQNFIKNNWKD